MAHPVNPSDTTYGDLPKHLNHSGYFGGDSYWYSVNTKKASVIIPTEWEIPTAEKALWLLPLEIFIPLYNSGIDGMSSTLKGSNRHTITIDLVVARPDAQKKSVTYGPASHLLRIRPHIDHSGKNNVFEYWDIFL
jgi:hypothetical protein